MADISAIFFILLILGIAFPALLSAAAKLNTGDIKYSPTDGLPTLKKAIVRYTEDNYDRLVAPENMYSQSFAAS